MTAPRPDSPAPGTYRFEVASAAEAVAVIQERLGPEARVLAVNPRRPSGLSRLWSSPRFEIVAELPPPAPVAEPPAREPAAALALADGARLPALLRRSGFPERLVARMESSPGWTRALARPLHEAIADLSRDLRSAARPARPLPDRVAFLGGSGCGRTTALCKRLAREVLSLGRPGRVWRVEFDRPNPAPSLDVFGEALGVSVEHYTPGYGAAAAPADGFLYADLPSLPAAGSPESGRLRRFLDAEGFDGRVLVLNAAYEPDALRAAHARGVAHGATHLVLTHLDETPRWGRLWEILLEGELSPLFLSTGPGLTGEMTDDVLGAVLARTLPAPAASPAAARREMVA